ncbi:general transcription factor 3C polypeptide 4-like [Antedon mediterranea]|uniref:general transcription factor 3C polypeptide 4-like n=1 Tax=Antedon mediterranea TaxID=105859 RepID=UPI003AF82BD1
MSASINIASALHGCNSVAISDDLTVAVASEKTINIFRLVCKIENTSNTFVCQKCAVEYEDHHYYSTNGLSVKKISDKLTSNFNKNCDGGARFHIDGTIGKPTGDAASGGLMRSVQRSICWSPKGCTNTNRCILSFLKTDHQLKLYVETTLGKWKEVVNVSSMLLDYAKDKGYRLRPDPGGMNIIDLAINRFSMVSINDMCWSGVYNERIEAGERAYTVLVTYTIDGLLIFWKCLLPFISKDDISLIGILDAGIPSPSSIKWEQKSKKLEDSLLVVGTTDGRIQILKLNFDPTKEPESQVTLANQVTLWEEDLIEVSFFWWSLFDKKENEMFYRLVCAKGQYILVFDLNSDENGNPKVIRKGYTHALHSSQVTGLGSDGDVITVVSRTMMKQKITVKVEGSLLVLSTTVAEAPKTRSKISYGTVFSPNAAFSVEVCTNIKRSRKRHKSDLVKFNWEIEAEELHQQLLNPDQGEDIANKLEYLELFRQSVATAVDDEEVDQLSIPKPDAKSKGHNKYLNQLNLFNCKLKAICERKRPHGLEEDHNRQQTITNMEAEADKITETLLAEHLMASLRLWEVSQQSFTETEISTVYVALNWLSSCNALCDGEEKMLVNNIYDSLKKTNPNITHRESCCLCQNDIPFTNIYEDECKNKHNWRRCSQSLQLCQRSQTNYCDICGAIAIKPKADDWSKMFLKTNCINCGGQMIPW